MASIFSKLSALKLLISNEVRDVHFSNIDAISLTKKVLKL